jgi:hypothetical protein
MAETANGEVSNASQPAFQAYTASGQANHAKDAYVTVYFDGEIFDQGGDFNIGTYTFTAPVTGKYQLNLILNLDQLADDSSVYQVEIVTSNHNYYNFINPNKLFEVGKAPQHCFTMSVLADMDAADTAFVRVYQTGGTVQTDIPQNYSSFSGYLAC